MESRRVGKNGRYGISYGWTLPGRSKSSYRIKGLLCAVGEFFREYCDNSSLVGYKYLSEPCRPWSERILWIVIHATTMCALGFMIIGLWQQYVCTPVVTVVDSDNYPSDKLEFPGIAVCSINRISRRAAEDLAKKIKTSRLINKTFDDIFELVAALGGLYDTAFEKRDDDGTAKRREDATHEMFRTYLGDDYDITDVMKLLTPKCTDILLACFYKNALTNCSDLLTFRKTQNGFCCTFNYAREADDIPSTDDFKKYTKISSKEIGSPGIANGLTVVLEPFIDDYLFPFLPTTGWMITIFNPGDYPDNTSGGVSEALISPSSESFLELSASSFYSENEIRSVPVESRKCMFTDETSAMQTGYTYSDCIVDCRATAIWNSCHCRPFFLPRRGNDEYDRRICSTADSTCMHNHKSTWWSVLPHTPSREESSSYATAIGEGNESLQCKNCYPACTDIHYYLQVSSASLLPGSTSAHLLPKFEIKDHSIVNIYFKKYGSVRLKQDIGYYWYELLSNIGGICGVFIGFSLLSIVELLYFAVRHVYVFFSEYGELEAKPRDQLAYDISSVRGLYWNEILGQSKLNSENRVFQSRRIQRY